MKKIFEGDVNAKEEFARIKLHMASAKWLQTVDILPPPLLPGQCCWYAPADTMGTS
jgi:hypothetical protein